MKKKLLSTLLAVIMVVGTLVPMMVSPVSADTAVYANQVYQFNSSSSGKVQLKFSKGSYNNTASANGRYFALYFIYNGTNGSSVNMIALTYGTNNGMIGYSAQAGGYFGFNDNASTPEAIAQYLNAGQCLSAASLVKGKMYKFEWYVNNSSTLFYVDGTLITSYTSAIGKSKNVYFMPQGVNIDIVRTTQFVIQGTADLNSSLVANANQGTNYAAYGHPFSDVGVATSGAAINFGTTFVAAKPSGYTLLSSYSYNKYMRSADATTLAVYNDIENLPATNNITLNNESTINDINWRYNHSLNDGQRSWVDNASTLVNAIAKINELKAAQRVSTYHSKVAAIGTVAYTDACNNLITDAENYYNNYIVPNGQTGDSTVSADHTTMQNARNEYNRLKGIAEAASRVTEYKRLVGLIGTVVYTSACNTAIQNAENYYNNTITPNGQTSNSEVVTAHNTQVAARTAYTNLTTGVNNFNTAVTSIGTVSASSAAAISNAEGLYSGLTSEQKTAVSTNYSTLTKSRKAYNAIAAINGMSAPNWNTDYTSVANAITAADNASAWTVTSGRNNYIGGYNSKITERDRLAAVHNTIAGLPASANVTLAHKSVIESARSAFDALSTSYGYTNTTTTGGNYSTLTDAETAYNTLKNGEVGRIVGIINAIVIDASSDATIVAAENATNSSTNTKWSNSDISDGVAAQLPGYATTISNARAKFNAINPVYTQINNLPAAANVTVEHETAIQNARAAYDALASHAQGDLRSYLSGVYSKLTDAEDALAALTAGPSVEDMRTAIAAFDYATADQAALDALLEYIDSTNWSGLTQDERDAVTTARDYYATVHPVCTAITTLASSLTPASVTLASYSAIHAVESSYDGLATDDLKALVSNYGTLDALLDAYDERLPQVYMTGTPDSSKIKSNVYFELSDGEDLSAITVTVDGVTCTLDNATYVSTKSAGEGKKYYILSTTKPAKEMTVPFSYSISGYGTTYSEGTTTVADYCNSLLEYTNSNKDKEDAVHAVAQAMLNYGRAAQTYFGFNTGNLPENGEVPSATVTGDRFDSTGLIAATTNIASCPVRYTAINVTFKDDTTLYIAFSIKASNHTDSGVRTNALNWVKSHLTFGGKAISDENANYEVQLGNKGLYTFIIIKIKNIPIKDIDVPQEIRIDGDLKGTLSVMNYIVVAQTSTSANAAALKALTQGLLVYHNAVETYLEAIAN